MKIISIAMLLAACGGQQLTAQEKAAAADSAYLAETLACVDNARTLQESKDCRAGVRAKWDAGAEGGSK